MTDFYFKGFIFNLITQNIIFNIMILLINIKNKYLSHQYQPLL